MTASGHVPTLLLPDPPVRADRLCAQPGCRKPLVEITARHRRYAGDALLSDPFCSSTCCRTYHHNPLPEVTRTPGPDIAKGHGGSGVVHGTRDSYRLCACRRCTAAVKGEVA